MPRIGKDQTSCWISPVFLHPQQQYMMEIEQNECALIELPGTLFLLLIHIMMHERDTDWLMMVRLMNAIQQK